MLGGFAPVYGCIQLHYSVVFVTSTPQALSQSHSRQNKMAKNIGGEVLMSALDLLERVVTWDLLGPDGDLEPFEGPCSL